MANVKNEMLWRVLAVIMIGCNILQTRGFRLSAILSNGCYRTLLKSRCFSDSVKVGIKDTQKARMDKLLVMQRHNINPYAYNYNPNMLANDIKMKYSHLENGSEDHAADVSVAGRIMIRRFFGKLAFFELRDESGSIQLYIDKKIIGNEFANIKDWTDSGMLVTSINSTYSVLTVTIYR